MRRLMAAGALVAMVVVGCGGGGDDGGGDGGKRPCEDIERDLEAYAQEVQQAAISGDTPPDPARQEQLAREIAQGCTPPG